MSDLMSIAGELTWGYSEKRLWWNWACGEKTVRGQQGMKVEGGLRGWCTVKVQREAALVELGEGEWRSGLP